MNWNDERIELLKKLWSEGLSASQIATELGGVTRNAVIGKVTRLGLSGRAKGVSHNPLKAEKTKAMAAMKAAKATPAGGSTRDGDAFIPIPPAPGLPTTRRSLLPSERNAASRGVSLMDLKDEHCRWVTDDTNFLYCGHQRVKGLSYCGPHARMTYQPAQDRRHGQRLGTPDMAKVSRYDAEFLTMS